MLGHILLTALGLSLIVLSFWGGHECPKPYDALVAVCTGRVGRHGRRDRLTLHPELLYMREEGRTYAILLATQDADFQAISRLGWCLGVVVVWLLSSMLPYANDDVSQGATAKSCEWRKTPSNILPHCRSAI